MHSRESLRIALHCMRAGRLRTVLTMLGIVVSVAVVITGSGLNNGLVKAYSDASDANFASITVTPLTAAPTSGGPGARHLDDSDVETLSRSANPALISDVVPIVSGSVMMRHGSAQYRATVVGSSAGYLQVQSAAVSLTAGSNFTSKQYQDRARVVLLGPILVKALFGGDAGAAIGSTVQFGRLSFDVIGTIGPSGPITALMPLTTARGFLFGGMHHVQLVDVLATHESNINDAINQVNSILDRQHFIKSPALRDFVAVPTDATGPLIDQLVTLLAWFTAGTTGIALFIGALGLANIMLITVTERTREIGVRRAIGARRGVILRQFLIEAIMIAGIGGIVGVAAGVALTLAGRRILPRLAPMYGVPELSPEIATLAFGLSLLVGLIAGAYPAIKAARLQPWDALRH